MSRFQKMSRIRARVLLALTSLVSIPGWSGPGAAPQVLEAYGKLPLSFEANQGQTDPNVKFLARGAGYTLFLTGDAAILSLHREQETAVLRMTLEGANTAARMTGADVLPGKSNYFSGSDRTRWLTNVPTYGAVKYSGVYPGIDLVYHGNQQLLEYDFVVAPGADPGAIDIRLGGASKLRVNREGTLVIGLGASEVIERAPVVYQDIGGRRRTVAGRYVLRGKDRVGFRVAEFDRSQPLVIDPTLVYSTYMTHTYPAGTVDALGNVYVSGVSFDGFLPTTPGAFQTAAGEGSAFIAKLNPSGSGLVYSTYLGVCCADASAIAVDASGNAYVTGFVQTADFPTTPGAFQSCSYTGYANNDAFVTKLNATGSALLYSTCLGGASNLDWGNSIAVDSEGSAYVTGFTHSADFPTTRGAYETTYRGGDTDGFITKLNAAGLPVYSTYLGGSDQEYNFGIAVDGQSNVYVTGFTCSSDFPTTPGALQPTSSEGCKAFVTKLDVTGSAPVYSTYVGAGVGSGIAVDALGNAYITGSAEPGFPTTPGAFQTTAVGYYRAFVSKLNATGSVLVYSTYLSGSYVDIGLGIAVDSSGSAYVTGRAASTDFPTTPDALQASGSHNAFFSKLNATGSVLLYSTYLGGPAESEGRSIAIDPSGSAYVIGLAGSGFPTTPGAFEATYSDVGSVGFVSKFSFSPVPLTMAILAGPAGNNGWHLGTVTVTLAATAGSSPISAIYYSVEGGAYQRYLAPFPISGSGNHQLLYYGVDTTGKQETPHGQTIRIDAKPVSHVVALPATAASPNFSVQWYGTDTTSAIANYSIYVSDSGGAFTPWLSHVSANHAYFLGSLQHTYHFYSIAMDAAGNVEDPKSAAEATTYVPKMAADVNADGRIDCADIARVKAAFGKHSGQAGFDPSADVNGDGVVDVRDLANVSQKLVPGTACP